MTDTETDDTETDIDNDPSRGDAIATPTGTSCCDGAAPAMTPAAAAALAAQLGAVADPVRLQVLSIIAAAPGGEVCACDFVDPIGKSQPTISHHLKVLSEAGLIDAERRGRWVWYRLAASGLGEVVEALAAVTSAPAEAG